MSKFKSTVLFVGILVLSLALLSGCGGKGDAEPTVASDTQLPVVAINAPLNQAVLPAGQAIQVIVVASDGQAIARVELYVDNSLIESRIAPSGSVLTMTSEQFVWSASIIGSHTLQARAYNATGQMGASSIVGVEVQMPGVPTTAPVASPLPGPTSPPADATAAPSPAITTEPAPTATPEQALVTANLNANVRNGPGTNYAVTGGLNTGDSAMVTGRNTNSSWWQISFRGGVAWIANSVVTASPQAYNAPVASAPPPPPTNTPLPPTATPMPLAPTNTPAPTTGLWVDQTTVSAGQCTMLRWNFTNIKAFYLSFGYGYDKESQPGQGSRQVCPSVTTSYEATVVKQNDQHEGHSVAINVTGSGCGDPWINRFVSTTYDIAANTKFSIFWDVECAKSVKLTQGGGPEQGVGGQDSQETTITGDTIFRLVVEKNSGGHVYASFTVTVK